MKLLWMKNLNRWPTFKQLFVIVCGLIILSALALHVRALWRFAPSGHSAIILSSLVFFSLWIAPGLCWLRLGVKSCTSLLDRILFVLTSSIASSGLLIWSLYFAGCYTHISAWAYVLIIAGSGLWVTPWRKLPHLSYRIFCFVSRFSWIELIVMAIIAGFTLEVSLNTIGSPLTSWDAIISWDKWACDMAERSGIGTYSMGGYPQLLPSLCSVTYKLSGTWLNSFPDVQLLMHNYAAPFVALLFLALIRLCCLWRASLAACLLLVASIGPIHEWWRSGYVDVPTTAIILAATALLSSLTNGHIVLKNRAYSIAWISVILFGVGFSKGYGLLWLLFIPLITIVGFRRRDFAAAENMKIFFCGLGLAILLLLPFFVHQRWLTSHANQADANPRLHTFTVEISKPTLYNTSWTASKDRILGAIDGMGYSHNNEHLQLPSVVRRAIIGCGVLLGTISGGGAVLAGATLAQWWVWEKTTAYDWRNLIPALVMCCILFSIGLKRVESRMGRAGPVAGLIIVLGIVYPWILKEMNEISGSLKTIGSRESVAIWAKPAEKRLKTVAPHQYMTRVIMEQSPLGKRAAHIYVPDELYRHLGQRGIYTAKGNAFTRIQSGDLLVRNTHDYKPQDFTPIATLRLPGYESLSCCRPVLTPVSWSIARSEGVETSTASAGLLISGKGWLDLRIDPLLRASSGDSVILALLFSSPTDAKACSLEIPESWDAITNIRSRITPITDGSWIRTLIWMDRGEGFAVTNSHERIIRLRISNTTPINLVAIQAEILRADSYIKSHPARAVAN